MQTRHPLDVTLTLEKRRSRAPVPNTSQLGSKTVSVHGKRQRASVRVIWSRKSYRCFVHASADRTAEPDASLDPKRQRQTLSEDQLLYFCNRRAQHPRP